jgi:hypothetical protein
VSKRSWARAALSHSAFTGISCHHLGRLVAELAGPWQARRDSALRQRRGADRRRAQGAGRRHDLVFADRVLVTLAVLRLQVLHAALAAMYGVHRSTVTPRRARSPAAAGRPGVCHRAGPAAFHPGRRVRLRRRARDHAADRRQRDPGPPPSAAPPGRRAFVCGKKKMNTIKFTKICDGAGRTLWDGTLRPGRQHDQTALQTDGIDDLLEQFPEVTCEMDAGYRGLHRDHPGLPSGMSTSAAAVASGIVISPIQNLARPAMSRHAVMNLRPKREGGAAAGHWSAGHQPGEADMRADG